MGESNNMEDIGYLQDIISYIFDEKKIVTYKWISNVLAVHVNRAKQLLYTFIKHISEERLKELKITYLVGGILPNDRGCRLQVVSENDLEKVKAQFKVITSEHIYSVSLQNCLTELQDLCSVDGVKDSKVGRYGAVKCSKSIARSTEETLSRRQGAYNAVDDEKKWPTAQQKQQEKESSAGSNDKKSSKTSNGISAMFAAQNGKKKAEDKATSKKPEVQKGESASSPEKKVTTTKNALKGGKPPANRLAAMFSAQNAKPKAAKNDVQEENKSKSDKEDLEKDAKVSVNNSKLVEKHEERKTDNKNVQEKPVKAKKKSESKKPKQKKRKASDNEEQSKKRKRIVIMDSDSSDDDVFGSDDDDDDDDDEEEEVEDKFYSQTPLENEEEVEETKEVAAPKDPDPPEPEANGHHGRKRHLVDKTYMDEYGYMVTKKVYEFVSCGESESDGEKENTKTGESKKNKTETQVKTEAKAVQGPHKSTKSINQKKNSSPEKKKQATLMNFFKRS